MDAPSARKDNLYFFNNVRSSVVILVVLLHAALAYSAYTRKWWIAVSGDSTIVADIICGSFDIILMPVLFFISGFFTPPSFDRSGAAGFISKKFRALYIPFIAGVILLNPVLVIIIRIAHGEEMQWSYIPAYFMNFISIPAQLIQDRTRDPYFFSHYHLWYLSLLFYFSAGYTLVRMLAMKIRISIRMDELLRGGRMTIACMALIILSGAGYAIMRFVFGETWFVISVIQFQISRIIPYLCFFVFGIIVYRNGRTTPVPEKLRPEPLLAGAVILMPGLLLITEGLTRDNSPAGIIAYGVLRYAVCAAALGGITGVAGKYFNTETPFNWIMNRSSFGLYLVHLDIVAVLLYLFTHLVSLRSPVIELTVIFAASSCAGTAAYYLFTYARSRLLRMVVRLRSSQGFDGA